MTDTPPADSSGVQQLIDRLREEGVEKGRTEADATLDAARRQAVEILDDARRRADEMLDEARTEAERTKRAGEEAIRLAGRDATLGLTEELRDGCKRTLLRLVAHSLKDPAFLRQLILAVAGEAVPEAADAKLNFRLLSDEPGPDGEDAMQAFAESLAGESLRDGLTFEAADSDVPGVRVQVVDGELEIDLTADTLTHLLYERLSPRFRQILEA